MFDERKALELVIHETLELRKNLHKNFIDQDSALQASLHYYLDRLNQIDQQSHTIDVQTSKQTVRVNQTAQMKVPDMPEQKRGRGRPPKVENGQQSKKKTRVRNRKNLDLKNEVTPKVVELLKEYGKPVTAANLFHNLVAKHGNKYDVNNRFKAMENIMSYTDQIEKVGRFYHYRNPIT